jgi:hypothetical protein
LLPDFKILKYKQQKKRYSIVIKELKKRKRAKAVNGTHAEDSLCNGVEGLENDVTRLGNGTDNVMLIDNPIFDANNVTAGPDDQACREP